MAKRTVKRGAIRSKQLQAKGHSKSDRKWKFHKYRRLTFEQAREEGVIEARKFVKKDGWGRELDSNTAELAQSDYFFRKRRKLNWVTRQKFGTNGLDYYGNPHSKAWKWITKKKHGA